CVFFFFFQAEDGIRDRTVTGVQTCALPISRNPLFAAQRMGQPRLYNASTSLAKNLPRRESMIKRSLFTIAAVLVLVAAWSIGRRSEERRVGKECRAWGAGGY